MTLVFRLLFAAALLGVCVVIARAKTSKLELRSKALEEFLVMARQLEALIRVNSRPIPDALGECAMRMGDKWTGRFASIISEMYGSHSEASGLWGRALAQAAKDFEEAASLSSDDRQIVTLFGDQLASSDLKSIGENYALLYTRLNEKLQESDRDRAVKGRLYRTIGTLAGLAAAIVVI